jgi:hypothetical protein
LVTEIKGHNYLIVKKSGEFNLHFLSSENFRFVQFAKALFKICSQAILIPYRWNFPAFCEGFITGLFSAGGKL